MSTVPQALAEAAARYGSQEAIADGDYRISFADLLVEVRTAARFYAAVGVQPGDHVAVWAPNTYRWVIAALGAHYAGATLVPINTRYTAHEALDILERTRAKVLAVTGPFLGTDRLADLLTVAGDSLPHLSTVLILADRGDLVVPQTSNSPRSVA